jgi:IclR helix-turn-helix domain.
MQGTTEPGRRGTDTTVDRAEATELLWALDDEDCRTLLGATAEGTLSVAELADTCELPLSTTYRKVNTLVEAGLLVEEVRLCGSGRHRSEYRLGVEEIYLSVTPDGVEVAVSGREESESRTADAD